MGLSEGTRIMDGENLVGCSPQVAKNGLLWQLHCCPQTFIKLPGENRRWASTIIWNRFDLSWISGKKVNYSDYSWENPMDGGVWVGTVPRGHKSSDLWLNDFILFFIFYGSFKKEMNTDKDMTCQADESHILQLIKHSRLILGPKFAKMYEEEGNKIQSNRYFENWLPQPQAWFFFLGK